MSLYTWIFTYILRVVYYHDDYVCAESAIHQPQQTSKESKQWEIETRHGFGTLVLNYLSLYKIIKINNITNFQGKQTRRNRNESWIPHSCFELPFCINLLELIALDTLVLNYLFLYKIVKINNITDSQGKQTMRNRNSAWIPHSCFEFELPV